MSEFYVTCVDNGTVPDLFTIGKSYSVFVDRQLMDTDTDLPLHINAAGFTRYVVAYEINEYLKIYAEQDLS